MDDQSEENEARRGPINEDVAAVAETGDDQDVQAQHHEDAPTKTFQCPDCHLTYKWKKDMYRHRRLAHDIWDLPAPQSDVDDVVDAVHICNICDAAFTKAHGLYNHRRSEHTK